MDGSFNFESLYPNIIRSCPFLNSPKLKEKINEISNTTITGGTIPVWTGKGDAGKAYLARIVNLFPEESMKCPYLNELKNQGEGGSIVRKSIGCEKNNNKILIGIAGHDKHGKTTLACHLRGKYNFTIRSLADPLKEMLRITMSLSSDQLYGSSKETLDPRWNMTPREIMRKMGTELYREKMSEVFPQFGENFWILSFVNWYKTNNIDLVIVDDVRFQNEIDTIKSLGGFIIGVINPTVPKLTGSLHASEQLDIENCGADLIIINNMNQQYFADGDSAINIIKSRK